MEMPNESARKCSDCGNNSGTSCCAGIKLFGVQINPAGDGAAAGSSIRKSKSYDNFDNFNACRGDNTAVEATAAGYLSDGLVHESSKSHERKKGKPWSEEEHRSFLIGLEKLGKGDWKGIATNYVPTRNSSQVASHAQKYFIRRAATEKKRRRASVFDIPLTEQVDKPFQDNPGSQSAESSQPASGSASSSKSNNELIKGQASVMASERPPPIPIKKRGSIPDFRSTVYSPSVVPAFNQGFPAPQPLATPTVSWVPYLNFSGQSNGFLPGIRADLATCPPFLQRPPLLPTFCLQQGSAHAGSAAAPTTKKDELSLNIRNLTL